MKKFVITFFLLSFLNLSLSAGEFTGAGSGVELVLNQNNLSVAVLEQKGFKVLLGEVTGAGKTVALDALEFIVTKRDLMPMSEVTHINFKNPSAAKNLSDIQTLEFSQMRIPLTSIKAVILR